MNDFFITKDMLLCIASLSNVALSNLNLTILTLNTNDDLIPQHFTFKINSDPLQNFQYFTIAPGYIKSASISNPNQTTTSEITYLDVFICSVNNKPNLRFINLFIDYLSPNCTLNYPAYSTYSYNQLNPKFCLHSNDAYTPGDSKSYNFPRNFITLIHSLRIYVETNATIANRNLSIDFLSYDKIIFTANSTYNQTASLAKYYPITKLNASSYPSSTQYLFIPADLILPHDGSLTVTLINGNANDIIEFASIIYSLKPNILHIT